MPSALRLISILALVAMATTLAACGGSGKPQADPAPAADASSSSSTSNEQDSATVKLTQCLRDQGLDIPDASGHGAYAQLSPADRQKLTDALQGPCRKYQSQAFGDSTEPQSQGFLDAITAFTVCLRKNGVDVPDPDPANPFSVLHSIDQSDPRVASAAAACQDKLAALN